MRPERTDFRSKKADLRSERAELMLEKVKLRPGGPDSGLRGPRA